MFQEKNTVFQMDRVSSAFFVLLGTSLSYSAEVSEIWLQSVNSRRPGLLKITPFLRSLEKRG
jgi:hypothetical protein